MRHKAATCPLHGLFFSRSFSLAPSLPPSLLSSHVPSQAYSAEELYRREWRFHKEMKLWVKQEGGQYWYFDINHWCVLPPALLPFAPSLLGALIVCFLSLRVSRVIVFLFLSFFAALSS